MNNNHGVFSKNGERIYSAELPFHPGEILETELEARNIKKSAFALDIKMYPAHITDIIKGRRNISAAIALKFESALDIDADFWMKAQADYDLAVARKRLVVV